jgi:hypothetical protein
LIFRHRSSIIVVVPADAQPTPSYEELAGLVAVLADRVDVLEAENAEPRRRLGMNSGNSSTPPSKEPIAAKAGRKAKRSADRSSRERSKDRKPGGQQGHKGSGLTPSAVPDRAEAADVPAECRGCGADLADPATGASEADAAQAQVWDILPVVLEKVAWLLPRRRCGCCKKITTAVAPYAQAGSVACGPGINSAAVLLSSRGQRPGGADRRADGSPAGHAGLKRVRGPGPGPGPAGRAPCRRGFR